MISSLVRRVACWNVESFLPQFSPNHNTYVPLIKLLDQDGKLAEYRYQEFRSFEQYITILRSGYDESVESQSASCCSFWSSPLPEFPDSGDAIEMSKFMIALTAHYARYRNAQASTDSFKAQLKTMETKPYYVVDFLHGTQVQASDDNHALYYDLIRKTIERVREDCLSSVVIYEESIALYIGMRVRAGIDRSVHLQEAPLIAEDSITLPVFQPSFWLSSYRQSNDVEKNRQKFLGVHNVELMHAMTNHYTGGRFPGYPSDKHSPAQHKGLYQARHVEMTRLLALAVKEEIAKGKVPIVVCGTLHGVALDMYLDQADSNPKDL